MIDVFGVGSARAARLWRSVGPILTMTKNGGKRYIFDLTITNFD
jgi:hypothetical protein